MTRFRPDDPNLLSLGELGKIRVLLGQTNKKEEAREAGSPEEVPALPMDGLSITSFWGDDPNLLPLHALAEVAPKNNDWRERCADNRKKAHRLLAKAHK